MKVVFSDHALYQMRERNIPHYLVLSALNYPDKVMRQENGAKQAIKLFQRGSKNYALVVIYKELPRTRKIVTAFFSSKIKKYLRR